MSLPTVNDNGSETESSFEMISPVTLPDDNFEAVPNTKGER